MLRKITLALLVALLAVNPALAAGVPCAAWAKLLVRSCCCDIEQPVERSCCEEAPENESAGQSEEIAPDAPRCDCKAAPSDEARTARDLTVRYESSASCITWIEVGERISARALVPFDGARAPACTSSPPEPSDGVSSPASICARFLPSAAHPADLLTAIRVALL